MIGKEKNSEWAAVKWKQPTGNTNKKHRKRCCRAGEMAQRVRWWACKPGGLRFKPRTHLKKARNKATKMAPQFLKSTCSCTECPTQVTRLLPNCNSSSRGAWCLQPLKALALTMWQVHNNCVCVCVCVCLFLKKPDVVAHNTEKSGHPI